jgi:Hydrolytic ATP binding site of dynein motor region
MSPQEALRAIAVLSPDTRTVYEVMLMAQGMAAWEQLAAQLAAVQAVASRTLTLQASHSWQS